MIYSHSPHAKQALDAVEALTKYNDRIDQVVTMLNDGRTIPTYVRHRLAALGVPDRLLDWAEQQVAERYA